jgi:redox-sensitive bicupin YhaK (pirin superfamily)
MAIYRVFAGPDGESHIEEIALDDRPELGSLMNVAEVKVQKFDEPRNMDFHPLPERRLIVHLSGEVEIGASDGSKQVFRAGDVRLMEDTAGRGHTHVDRGPTSAAYIILND